MFKCFSHNFTTSSHDEFQRHLLAKYHTKSGWMDNCPNPYCANSKPIKFYNISHMTRFVKCPECGEMVNINVWPEVISE